MSMVRKTEILDIVPLLDDPDQYVRDALFRQLKNMGRPAIEELEGICRDENEDKYPGVEDMLSALREELKFEALRNWIGNTKDDLMTGLCFIQDLLSNDVDKGVLHDILMDHVNEIVVEINDNQTFMEKVKLYNHVFFNRLHYKTVDPMFSDPGNTYIHRALKNKTGSPVIIGIIYLLIAYHAGIPVRGRVFKGGFLPAVTDTSGKVLFYVNVYKNGHLFPHTELRSFLSDMNLQIPADSFREAQSEDLAQIYTETLYYSFSALEENADNRIVSKLEKIMEMFGKDHSLLIEIDEDDE
ncbi:MAG TPA: transglutaminase family protein [Bacteroidales bacterium]|nr:transglutaminase family protein [Bacteroidales bacterium]